MGDRIRLRDGNWLAIEDLLDTGEYETVYNFRAADFHMYFVGGEEWGFSVWAHNASYADVLASGANVINNNTARKNPKVVFLFNNRNDAMNWAATNVLGGSYQRTYNANGRWTGWSNGKGDAVYWGHGDWGKGVGTSTFPHLNYSRADGTGGHLFLGNKIANRGCSVISTLHLGYDNVNHR